MKAAAKRSGAVLPVRREPSDTERLKGKAAATRIVEEQDTRSAHRSELPRIVGRWQDSPAALEIGPDHTDAHGWKAQLVDALGVADPRAAQFLLDTATNGGFGPNPTDQTLAKAFVGGIEAALAFAVELRPQGPIEAALALQMAATHTASMTLARHVSRADKRDALADYSRMMNATMRTFTGQVEALSRLRTGGKQQVEVRYVYVDARTQTVVNAGGEAGGAERIGEQPHAPRAVGHAVAAGLPMWGADASGNALPVSSDQREAALPDARRDQPRSASRRSERQLQSGPLDERYDSRKGSGPRPCKTVPGDFA